RFPAGRAASVVAAVRRAGDGDLAVGQPEGVGPAAGDEESGDERLDRRPDVDGVLEIAGHVDLVALAVDDDDGAAVTRFGDPAAVNLDERLGLHARRWTM